MRILKEKDVVDMYKQGYSIDYIVKCYFDYKNKDGVKNHYFNGSYIVTKKKYSMPYCSKTVYSMLLKYNDNVLKA